MSTEAQFNLIVGLNNLAQFILSGIDGLNNCF